MDSETPPGSKSKSRHMGNFGPKNIVKGHCQKKTGLCGKNSQVSNSVNSVGSVKRSATSISDGIFYISGPSVELF